MLRDIVCPISSERLNKRACRVSATLNAALLTLFFFTHWWPVLAVVVLEYLVRAACQHHSSQFVRSPRRGTILRKVLHIQISNEAVWGRPMGGREGPQDRENRHLLLLGLTQRERDVLRLLVEGHSNKEIGAALSLSHRTVMHHVTGILSKLGVENRTAATHYAVRHGLV